jgi:hypothetical protein
VRYGVITSEQVDLSVSLIRAALTGALAAIVLAFPLAALTALVFRFPIPFGSYESGPAAVPLALMAVVFYGTLGGFLLLGVLGAGAGIVVHRTATNGQPLVTRILRYSLLLALAAVLTLAILDKLIGAW